MARTLIITLITLIFYINGHAQKYISFPKGELVSFIDNPSPEEYKTIGVYMSLEKINDKKLEITINNEFDEIFKKNIRHIGLKEFNKIRKEYINHIRSKYYLKLELAGLNKSTNEISIIRTDYIKDPATSRQAIKNEYKKYLKYNYQLFGDVRNQVLNKKQRRRVNKQYGETLNNLETIVLQALNSKKKGQPQSTFQPQTGIASISYFYEPGFKKEDIDLKRNERFDFSFVSISELEFICKYSDVIVISGGFIMYKDVFIDELSDGKENKYFTLKIEGADIVTQQELLIEMTATNSIQLPDRYAKLKIKTNKLKSVDLSDKLKLNGGTLLGFNSYMNRLLVNQAIPLATVAVPCPPYWHPES